MDWTLQPGIQIEIGRKEVDKAHAFQYTTTIEILAENHGHLIEAGGCPDLSVVIGQTMIAHTTQTESCTLSRRLPHPCGYQMALFRESSSLCAT